jgi:hypothetical protein
LKRLVSCAVRTIAFWLIIPCASAGFIDNLSTGLNLPATSISGSEQFTGDSVDANWIYNDPFVNSNVPAGYPTIGNAKVVAPGQADWSGNWWPNGGGSSWIAPDPDATNNGNAPYTFTLSFDLSNYELSSVFFTGGDWLISDAGTLTLNGNLVASSTGIWTQYEGFTVPNSDLVQGVNSLVITITGDDNNFEAVRLQGQLSVIGTGTPEPRSIFILIAGLGLMVAGARRKMKALA